MQPNMNASDGEPTTLAFYVSVENEGVTHRLIIHYRPSQLAGAVQVIGTWAKQGLIKPRHVGPLSEYLIGLTVISKQ